MTIRSAPPRHTGTRRRLVRVFAVVAVTVAGGGLVVGARAATAFYGC